MEPRFTFDQIAAVYAAARPGYPEALIDDVISYADLKADDAILEVGCGSGQATKSFAPRGFRIVAIEPGPELILAARESLARFGNVEFVEATFEAWPATPAVFRLLVAAQSWHWVSPEVRFAKAAEVLLPDGSLAVFGHVPVGLPGPMREEFKRIYLRHMGVWGRPPEAWYLPDGPFKGRFDESGRFGRVMHKSYSWKRHHTAASYTNFLLTRSDHRMLAPTKRQEILDEITTAISNHGGEFDMDYETHLYISRRVDQN
jgi:SAM-dependent methyltransferase